MNIYVCVCVCVYVCVCVLSSITSPIRSQQVKTYLMWIKQVTLAHQVPEDPAEHGAALFSTGQAALRPEMMAVWDIKLSPFQPSSPFCLPLKE